MAYPPVKAGDTVVCIGARGAEMHLTNENHYIVLYDLEDGIFPAR